MQSQDTIANNWNLEIEDWNFSPDTTDLRPISFPFWMVREIALDLEDKSRLEVQEELLESEIGTYKLLVRNLEHEITNKELQLELLQKNQQLLLTHLEAERNIKPTGQGSKWAVRLAAALGIGYILGSLN